MGKKKPTYLSLFINYLLGLIFLNKIIAIIKVINSAIGIAKNIPFVLNKNGNVNIKNIGKIKLRDIAIIIECKGL